MTNRYTTHFSIPEGVTTLPGRYYTDPEILRQEIEGVFERMWVHAGRIDEVPEPGDYVTRQLGNESVIIVRGEDDRIRAFYNNCRHRGTRICNEHRGHVMGSFQCPYHAWTYALDGKLVGAPHMNELPDFDKSQYPLLAVGCEVWDGHIFINLDSERRPLRAQLDGLPKLLGHYHMGEMRRWARHEYDIKANWKLIVENYSECYHCPLIHPALNRVTHYLSGKNHVRENSYNGGYQNIGNAFCTLTVEGKKSREPFKGLKGKDLNRVYYYVVYPNLLLSLAPDYMMTHTLWPKEPGVSHVVCEWHFDREQMGKPGFDGSDAVKFWDMTNKEDWHVCEISQRGVASRGYAPGPFSNQEEMLYAFDRWVLERLEGPKLRPLKKAQAR
ncbi:MAG: aromatic ring-hydroxylating dioxygenase subunit alpha [Acidobacteriota bacterium]